MTEDEPSDDYLSAAANVVNAARNLDEARRKFNEASEASLSAHVEKVSAEKALQEALDKHEIC
jgi:hypothetical protein